MYKHMTRILESWHKLAFRWNGVCLSKKNYHGPGHSSNSAQIDADQRGTKNWLHSPSEQGRCAIIPFHSGDSLQEECNSV